MSGPMQLKLLKATHPRLDLRRVAILHALYEGGQCLLGDDAILSAVMPKHAHEGADSWAERKATAYYENVFAQVVNHIVAGLAQDPAIFDDGANDADAKLDEYWKQLMKDSTPPDDDRPAKTFDQQMRAICGEALVTGFGWMLCDMPPPPAEPAASEAEQLERGDLDAYPVPYRADCVLDWEMSGGTFLWVRSYSCERPAADPTKPRAFTVHTWIVWERDTWTRYRVELDKDGKDPSGKQVTDEDVITPEEPQPHSFGRVPWVMFDACPGDEPSVHIGEIIESQCRALFNEENGEAFLRRRVHFQQLYEFLGAEYDLDAPKSEAQQDPGRARKGKRRGPDVVEVRGADDDAKFVAPNTNGVEMTHKAIEMLREAILRVVGQLALSQDTKGAMLRRSGDSKKQDKIAEEIALGAIGKRLLGCARQVAKLLALGRGDKAGSEPAVIGYHRFDVDDVDGLVDQAAIVENISIPSATFKIEHTMRLALALLGDDIDQDVRENIRKDLEKSITQDQFTNVPGAPLPPRAGAVDPNVGKPVIGAPNPGNAGEPPIDGKPPPPRKAA